MNRFQSLKVESDEPQQQAAAPVKKEQAPKKVVVKKAPKVEQDAFDQDGYERVTDNKQQNRGGRAARGTVEGRRGGDRGGRGRGRGGEGRGQRRPRTAAVDENGNPVNTDRVERGGRRQGYQGKPREDGHPQDRRQGHEIRRGDRKNGHGRGGMGNRRQPEKEEVEGETPAATENAETTPAAEEEKKEETPAPVEEEVKEEAKPQEEEEEETGITLDDFLANRKTANIKNKVRETEKINQKNIEENKDVKYHQSTIADNLQDKDTYGTKPDVNSHLFGFQGEEDFVEAPARGGRGGRGGRGARGGARGGRNDRPDTNRGGRRRGGNKLVVDDNAFPTL